MKTIRFTLFFVLCHLLTVANGQNYIVNSTVDVSDDNIGDGICDTGNMISGLPECTLRAAIEEVNQAIVPATIDFSVSGCVDDICILSPDRPNNGNWPDIVKPVTIDGSTQPGNASVCTDAIENRAEYKIVLAGDGLDIGLRLELGSDGSAIRGLNIREFFNNIAIINSDNNRVECNFIGTDETGMSASINNNANGVILGCNSVNNIVGGVDLTDGNLISGHAVDGIQFFTGFTCGAEGTLPNNNSVLGNYIGVNKLMTAKIGNVLSGISVFGSGVLQNMDIGRIINTQMRNPNVIGGSESGIYIDDGATGINVMGNYLGTDKTGVVDLGNEFGGVDIISGIGNSVGSDLTNDANVIAFNAEGVFITGLTSVSNRVVGNSFFNNSSQSIDIVVDGSVGPDGLNVNDPGDTDSGANTLINQPDLLSAKISELNLRSGIPFSVDVELLHDGEGGPLYSIDFDAYFSPVGDGNQGRFYLGSSLNQYNTPMQLVTETFSLPSGFDTGKIIVSATDNDNNTSEFAFIDIANPVINLFGNGMMIIDGSLPEEGNNTDFGTVAYAAGAIENTFVIQNNGVGTLNLTGDPIIAFSQNQSAVFSITQQPAVTELLAGETTTFTVGFDPTLGSDVSIAQITIDNDSRQTNPFTFDIVGQGLSTLEIVPISLDIDEGQTLQVQANLDDMATNDVVLDYEITGGVIADDFSTGSLSGSFTISQGSNSAQLNLVTVLDVISEGIEGFSMTITTTNDSIVHNTPAILNGTIEDSDIIFIDGFE